MEVKRKHLPEMLADSLREIGLLFLVFGIIEGVVGWKELAELGLTLAQYSIAVVAVTLVPWIAGAILERKRKS